MLRVQVIEESKVEAFMTAKVDDPGYKSEDGRADVVEKEEIDGASS